MSFVRQVSDWCRGKLNGAPIVNLSKDRGLSLLTIRRAHMGFNPITGNYTIPLYALTEEEGLSDLRYWKLNGKSGVHSSSGCKLVPWNFRQLEKAETIWLCEGEWDGMAFDEVLHNLSLVKEGEAALAVPGAGTFKPEWMRLFEKKHIRVLFDNDPAGEAGAIRVFNILKPIVEDIKFLHWESARSIGFDIRDLHNEAKNPKHVYDTVRALLHELPKGADSKSPIIQQYKKERLTGEGLSVEEVYKRYGRWLYMPKDWALLDVMYGAVLANRREGDPLWVFLVGPPSCGKTVPLISLSAGAKILTTTSLTPSALVSGASFGGGGDPSLIPRLKGKVLVVKDFTTILNLPTMERDEIFGILRDAYDGKTERQFGNGVYRKYENCFFGMLAGVTPAIEQFSEGCAALGERFLQYWIPIPRDLTEQRKFLQRARENEGHEEEMRKELAEVSEAVLAKDYKHTPNISNAIGEKLLDLAQITSIARGVVPRDKFTKDITHKAFHELGTRLTKQFIKLSIGIAQFRGESTITDHVFRTVKLISRGSIPSGVRGVLKAFAVNVGRQLTVSDIAEQVRLPASPTVSRILQNMDALGVLTKERKSSLVVDYQLSDGLLSLMQNTELFNN